MNFQNIHMNYTIAITSNKYESTSPWKMYSWIFTSAKFFLLHLIPLSSISYLPLLILWLYKISCTSLNILESRIARPSIRPFCCHSTPWLNFSASLCSPCGCPYQCIAIYLVPLVHLCHLFCSSGNSPQHTSALSIFLINGRKLLR